MPKRRLNHPNASPQTEGGADEEAPTLLGDFLRRLQDAAADAQGPAACDEADPSSQPDPEIPILA
jgi:hypothetical protein